MKRKRTQIWKIEGKFVPSVLEGIREVALQLSDEPWIGATHHQSMMTRHKDCTHADKCVHGSNYYLSFSRNILNKTVHRK